jgi:chromosome segregation ATPase
MGIPNPGAIRREIQSLEGQKGEAVSSQREKIQMKISELIDTKAQIQGHIMKLNKNLSDPRVPPQAKSQVREQLSHLNRQKAQIEASIARLYAQREAVKMQIEGQFGGAIAQRRQLLSRLAGYAMNQAVGDEVKGRKG